MMIPKQYKWMKPGVPVKYYGNEDFIKSSPVAAAHRWVVELKYHGRVFCGLVKQRTDLYALPSNKDSEAFQVMINSRLKAIRASG